MNGLPFGRMVGAALGAAAVVFLSACSKSGGPSGDPLAGQPVPGSGIALTFAETPAPLPAFNLVDLDGRAIDQASWTGKVVVLNFWATWCGPCRKEIPDLIALQERYRDSLVVVGLSVDDGPAGDVHAFVKAQGVNYPVAIASLELQSQFGGISSVPSTFIVTKDGKVTQRHRGLIRADHLEQEIRSLAGFPTAATVSLDAKLGPRLLNRSEFQSAIPGVDLVGLSQGLKIEALKQLNTEKCTCGCGLTVAQCLVDDPNCTISPGIAKGIMAKIHATTLRRPGL